MIVALEPPTCAEVEPPLARPRFRLRLERREDAAAVDSLLDAAFGPGRFAKTAERLREGAVRRSDLSWCVWREKALIGSVRTWPLAIDVSPGVFLGPIAVAKESRRQGLGALLVERVCEAAIDAGDAYVFLVGAASFFEPLGFEAVSPGRVRLPGPADPKRLFWRALRPGGLDGVAGDAVVPVLSRHAHRTAAS